MKTLDEIKRIIEDKLTANGFQKEQVFLNEGDYYFIPGKFDLSDKSGTLIEVTEVYRNNGTKQNASVQIEIIKWKNKRGHRISKDKIYNRNGDKTINQVIDSAIYFYNHN